jgi:hypothetical protein
MSLHKTPRGFRRLQGELQIEYPSQVNGEFQEIHAASAATDGELPFAAAREDSTSAEVSTTKIFEISFRAVSPE